MHGDIVAAGAAQPADRPRVDDFALAGGQQHEADLWATRRRLARLAVFMNDRPQNHPGCEFATADQRPAPAQAEAAVDDMRLTRGARTIGRDDIRLVMDGVRRLLGELGGGPMRIAVPHAPRYRPVRFRQLLEYGDAVHWCQVEPAVGRRQENAKKSRSGEGTRELFRHASGCLDSVALSDNAPPEVASSCKKLGAVRCIVRHHRWRFPRSDPRPTLAVRRSRRSGVPHPGTSSRPCRKRGRHRMRTSGARHAPSRSRTALRMAAWTSPSLSCRTFQECWRSLCLLPPKVVKSSRKSSEKFPKSG